MRCAAPIPTAIGLWSRIEGDNERAIDETFATEAAAQIYAEKPNQAGQGS